MISRYFSLATTGVVVVSLATACFAITGQEPGQSTGPVSSTSARTATTTQAPAAQRATNLVSGVRQEQGGMYGYVQGRGQDIYYGTFVQEGLQGEIAKATSALRSAESSDERSEARSELKSLLSKDYDERLDAYEEHLNELEERIKEMRSQLERRRDARSDMVELRLKVLEAEADDLGWPSQQKPNFFSNQAAPIMQGTYRSNVFPAPAGPSRPARLAK